MGLKIGNAIIMSRRALARPCLISHVYIFKVRGRFGDGRYTRVEDVPGMSYLNYVFVDHEYLELLAKKSYATSATWVSTCSILND